MLASNDNTLHPDAAKIMYQGLLDAAKALAKQESGRKAKRIFPGLKVQPDIPVIEYRTEDMTEGINLAPIGEYMAILSLPGTGKTQLSEAINASYLKDAHGLHGDTFGFNVKSFRRPDGSLRPIVFIDTERTDAANKKSNEKIHRRLQVRYPSGDELARPIQDKLLNEDGSMKGLEHYAFASIESAEECREELDRIADELSLKDENGEVIPETGPAVFVIDGILDFAESLNGEEIAKAVIKWLRSNLNYRAATGAVTMHPNKGTSDFAGHLGAFVYRWCSTAMLMRVSDVDPSIRIITCERTLFPSAKIRYSPLGFTCAMQWDENAGMMMSCEVPAEEGGRKTSGITVDDIRQVFTTFWLKAITEVPSGAAKELLCERKNIQSKTADRHFATALKKGWIDSKGNGPATKYVWIYDTINSE